LGMYNEPKCMEKGQAPVVEIENEDTYRYQVSLFIKREDLLHPYVSGNKWRKLYYNIQEAKKQDKKILLTFGGAFSNHIYALAAAGKASGQQTIGVIRGEENLPLNPTLSFAAEQGMHFKYISRERYSNKIDLEFIEELRQEFGNFYLVPEGGSNTLAVKGCSEIIDELREDFDYVCAACGTGGTLAGLISGLKGRARVLGFPVLKGADFLKRDIKHLIEQYEGASYDNWELALDYHFGGYAKWSQALVDFINDFKIKTQIPLDPIYTGKLMYGVMDMMREGFFPKGSKILAIHTGGLQGIQGFNQRFGKKIL
jgi:1-aminocyclopropane-1-carboxylate deaminase